MAIDLNNLAYPFDPTGLASTNKITGEQQVITGANYRDLHFLVPTYAPYYAEGLVVKFRATSGEVRTLVRGVDYYCTHEFIAASLSTAKDIFGSISFLDTLLTGVITLDYQTVGGIWTQDSAKIAQILADALHNPRTTSWDVIVDMPVTFPPTDHVWDLADLTGAAQVVTAIAGIEAALRQTGNASLAEHIANQSNPHQVTKGQVGLNAVQNFPIATNAEAIAGASNSTYMTPALVLAAMTAKAITPLANHTARADNPHGTTAAQVGAYTTAQVDTLLLGKLSTSAAAYDTTRFDAKTATEYRDWVLLGTAANSLKFNGLTYGQAKADILTGTAANSTLLGGKTLDQIKAEISSGGLGNADKFGGLTYAEAKADILTGTASNAAAVYGLTLTQLSASVLAGNAATATTAYGKDLVALTAYMRDQVGGWEAITVEVSTHPANAAATASGFHWIRLATVANLSTVALADALSNPQWIVTGGNARTSANPEANHQDCAYLVRCALTTSNGANSSSLLAKPAALALHEDIGLRFGARILSNTLELWLKTPASYRALNVVQLTTGIDVLSNIDDVASVVEVEPAGLNYGTADEIVTKAFLSANYTHV